MPITPMMMSGFNPLNIPGCALWLEADRGITLDGSNNVSAWADQSGNGRHVSQATDTKRPTYVAAALNGRPGIRWSGTTKNLNAVSSSLLQNCGELSMIFLFIPSSTTNIQCPLYTTGADGGLRLSLQHVYTPTDVIVYGRRIDGTATDTTSIDPFWSAASKLISVVIDYNNSALFVWSSGVPIISDYGFLTDGLISDTVGTLFIIGASNTGGGNQFLGDIVALTMHRKLYSTSERQYLERGFGHKYGITVA